MNIGELKYFRGQVPPEIHDFNVYARKLCAVLDGILDKRYEVIEEYKKFFDPRLVYKIEHLRRYVDDFGGEYLLNTPRAALECLYMHKYDIFSAKGTQDGFVQWLECLTRGTVTSYTFTSALPLLHFYDLDGGVLPNGQDLADELDGVTYTPPNYIATLLGGSWSDYYKTIDVTIDSPYVNNAAFIAFLQTVIPLYTPAIDPENTTINVTLT